MRIILLDLNYTLVANSEVKIEPFTLQVTNETYRMKLIKRIKHNHVIMITARPEFYKELTLSNIKKKTGWQPNESFFNYLNLPPPVLKESIIKKHILGIYEVQSLLAIESNPLTRAMYKRHSIQAITFDEFLNKERH